MPPTQPEEKEAANRKRRRITIEEITAMGSWEPVEDLDIMYDEQW